MSDLVAVFGINWKLLLIQALNFGALLAILTYLLYKPILKIIDERQKKIADGVKKAEAAEKHLASAQTEGKTIVGKAVREAEELVASARTHADEKGSEILKSAEMRADGILKDAAARAEEAKRQAMKQSEREIAKAAILAAEKILHEKTA